MAPLVFVVRKVFDDNWNLVPTRLPQIGLEGCTTSSPDDSIWLNAGYTFLTEWHPSGNIVNKQKEIDKTKTKNSKEDVLK